MVLSFREWKKALESAGFVQTSNPPYCMVRHDGRHLIVMFFQQHPPEMIQMAVDSWFRTNPEFTAVGSVFSAKGARVAVFNHRQPAMIGA